MPESLRQPRRLRTRLATLVLLAAALLVALLAAEGLLRLLPSSRLGFEYADGHFGKPREFAFAADYNSLGFHDREHRPRRPGVARLLLLGDSYVESYSVPLPETLGQRLEHHLNAAGSGRHEVVALGASRWGQVDQLAALEQFGPGLGPHLVVTLFLTGNDVRDNSRALQRAFREQLDVVRFRPGWPRLSAEAAPLFFFRGSRLNQLLSHRLALALRGDAPDSIPIDYFVFAVPPPPAWAQAWERTEQLLLATRQRARELGADYAIVSASNSHGVFGAEKGVELLVEAFPGMRHLEWDLDLPDRRLAELCRRHAIPFLALEPLFRRETLERGRRLHWPHDGHWNAEGNDFAAGRMAEFLLGEGGARQP
jgi:hypothetical protein